MTNRRQSLMLLGAGLAGTATSVAQASAAPQPLKLRLPFSSSENREDRHVLNLSELFFVITNTSSERLGVWEDWCSWGWSCPRVIIDIRDRRFEFTKSSPDWKRNFADPFYIEPDNHYILPVNLFSNDWAVPIGFNLLPDVESTVSISYTIKPDRYTDQHKVWTGTLEYQAKAWLTKG